MRRPFNLLALVSGLSLAGCDDITSPRAVATDAVAVRATLSDPMMSASSTTDSVVLRVTIHNPRPYPITIGTTADYPWWSLVITNPEDPMRGTWGSINAWRPLTLKAGADTVHAIVVYVRDASLGLTPGRYQVQGGLNRTLSAPLELQITP